MAIDDLPDDRKSRRHDRIDYGAVVGLVGEPGPSIETRQPGAMPTALAWSIAARHAAVEVDVSARMMFSPL